MSPFPSSPAETAREPSTLPSTEAPLACRLGRGSDRPISLYERVAYNLIPQIPAAEAWAEGSAPGEISAREGSP